jgi:2'-5' RNA ligase
VLWVGLERDEGYRSLEALFGRLEDALDARGLGREERAFAPHITLARTRDEISSAQRRALGEAIAAVRQRNRVTGAFAVRELIVMRSDLSRTGPRYTPLATLPLAP